MLVVSCDLLRGPVGWGVSDGAADSHKLSRGGKVFSSGVIIGSVGGKVGSKSRGMESKPIDFSNSSSSKTMLYFSVARLHQPAVLETYGIIFVHLRGEIQNYE